MKTIFFDTIDSTNSWVKENYTSLDKQTITCVSADMQTRGKGRQNRSWHSPSEENIYASFYFTLSNIKNITTLAQLMCICLLELLKEHDLDCLIKWPNDVYLNGKKLSGSLCEVVFDKDIHVILGVGINLNTPQNELDMINQAATSLSTATEKKWDKDLFLNRLQAIFLKNLNTWKGSGFKSFEKIINQHLLNKNKTIKINLDHKTQTGTLLGISPEGALVLNENGIVHHIFSGDVV